MNTTPLRLVILWSVGACVGTLVVAVTSPWFVRSYLPLQADTVRGVWTLPSDSVYRWRSEGYADSRIGPYGMPGKRDVDPDFGDSTPTQRVALWGDSQAEGVCLRDSDKLFSQLEQESSGRLDVFPLARSGEDAAVWLTQMHAVEQALGIERHVMLVAELSDLLAATQAPVPAPREADAAAANGAIAARLPAFIIQGARHLLREEDGSTPRRLRFGIGPVGSLAVANGSNVEPATSAPASRWRAPLAAIRAASQRPITLVYAPRVPHIIDGQVRWEDPDDDDFHAVRSIANELELVVVDARAAMRQSAAAGKWPHGFHNGQIGVGHLNRIGNAVLAEQLAESVKPKRDSRN